jgi:hypothetical protein
MMNAFKYSLDIVRRHMLTVEYPVYVFMRKLAHQYTGGYCNYFELSNGGFYIAPTHATSFNVCIDTNGFEGQMIADAAGITACLFALSHRFLETPEAKLREEGPILLAGVPANYDPMPVLRNLDTPQLWILAADDHDAPSAETEQRLRALQAKGKPITVAIFPNTEHGIYNYETKADGQRVDTRNPEGYFAMTRDFILRSGLGTQRYGTSGL